LPQLQNIDTGNERAFRQFGIAYAVQTMTFLNSGLLPLSDETEARAQLKLLVS